MRAVAAADTKQKLIDTTLELLWKNSYGSVSVDDICKTANVKKGSFYHYFPSKLDLAIAAMEQDLRHSVEACNAIFSASVPPLQRFEKLADYIYEVQADIAQKYGHVCGCPCISIASEMAGQSDALSAKFEEIATIKKRYFESTIRDLMAEGVLPAGTDAKAKAQELYHFVSGEVMLARIHNDLTTLKEDLKAGFMRTLSLKGEAQSA